MSLPRTSCSKFVLKYTIAFMTSAGSGEGDDAASVDSRGEPMPERRMGRDEEFEELLARCSNNIE